MGNGNSTPRPSPRPPPPSPSPPPPFPPRLPPAPYTQQLLGSGATCARTAVSAGVGFDAAGCMQQAAAANGPYWCFALAPAIGACYVCEACESSSLIGHSFYRWFDIYSPLPPPTPVPPAPLESRPFAPDTLCTDRFDLAEHGGASGFDEQSCFNAAFDALYPAADACFALYAAAGVCYVCKNCTPSLSNVFGYALYSATWHYSPPTPPSPSPPPPSPPSPPPPPSPSLPPVPPAPLESRPFAPDTLCTDRFDLAEHGGASGFDEQSCFNAAFDALYPAADACFALYAAAGACYVCKNCTPSLSNVFGHALYSATWHYSPPTPPSPSPPPSTLAPPATATASLTAAVLAASAVHTAAAWKWCYLCTYSGECRCRF